MKLKELYELRDNLAAGLEDLEKAAMYIQIRISSTG
jgi:hypothetical protein